MLFGEEPVKNGCVQLSYDEMSVKAHCSLFILLACRGQLLYSDLIRENRERSSVYLQEFLSQFLQLNQRCRGEFEPVTERIPASAAQLQCEILGDLVRLSPDPSNLSSDAMVLALGLHLYAVLRPFEAIEYNSGIPMDEGMIGEWSPVLVLEADLAHAIPSSEAHRKSKGGN
jgi:hypothetical protein